MGIFVDYNSDPFANVTDTPTTILTTTAHPLIVNGLIVCNRTANPMRFNLRMIRTATPAVDPIFIVNEFLIAPYETVDVVAAKGLEIFLKYSASPNPIISDSLECFTNGYTQKVDVYISYTVLNDLPLSSC